MSGILLSIATPETAASLLRDPEFSDSLIVRAALDEIVTPAHVISWMEVAIANRFDVSRSATSDFPMMAFHHNSAGESMSRAYEKICATQPQEVVLHYEPTEDWLVEASYILPLTGFGKQQHAITSTYVYEARERQIGKKKPTTLLMLGRYTTGSPKKEDNPFYIPPNNGDSINPASIGSSRIATRARQTGRAGAYKNY